VEPRPDHRVSSPLEIYHLFVARGVWCGPFGVIGVARMSQKLFGCLNDAICRIPFATQERIFAMHLDGLEACEISFKTGVCAEYVRTLVKHGAPAFLTVEPWRCPKCAGRSISKPCAACWYKRAHRHSRKLRDA
jgi:hypothetical protein